MRHMRKFSAHFIRLAVFLFAILATTLAAPAEDLSASSLDDLFSMLKAAPNAAAATDISSAIWTRWMSPSDPELSALITKSMVLREAYELRDSLDVLNDIIARYPDYAEGWNQRATLEFMLGDYPDSLNDIAETLKREPRHFGALSGQALVYLKMGEDAKALQSIVDALAIHPFLNERGLFPQLMQPATRT